MQSCIKLLGLNIENSKYKNDFQEEYDKMLQKLEAEIRNHIRTEQQLKLCIEGLQEKIEDYNDIKEKYNELHEVLLQNNSVYRNLRNVNQNLKK